MTVRLSVRTAVWRSQIARYAARLDGLVPVVKGNGYGFGRARLAEIAADFSSYVAVGNVHELAGLPSSLTPIVLTPTLRPPRSTQPILTVGRREHIAALSGWDGRVIVKLSTELRRYGGDAALIGAVRAAGLGFAGVALHPPLAGTDDDRVRQVLAHLADVPRDTVVWVSHLGPEAFAALPDSHRFRLRVGTALWHGDKSSLQLEADVLNVRPVEAGQVAGYRSGEVASSGHLVMIGAGTANGVTELPDGRSPFHFGRQRMALHESPHMHTSMAFVPDGQPLPSIGSWVDVQRPLHMTHVDEYRWQ